MSIRSNSGQRGSAKSRSEQKDSPVWQGRELERLRIPVPQKGKARILECEGKGEGKGEGEGEGELRGKEVGGRGAVREAGTD